MSAPGLGSGEKPQTPRGPGIQVQGHPFQAKVGQALQHLVAASHDAPQVPGIALDAPHPILDEDSGPAQAQPGKEPFGLDVGLEWERLLGVVGLGALER